MRLPDTEIFKCRAVGDIESVRELLVAGDASILDVDVQGCTLLEASHLHIHATSLSDLTQVAARSMQIELCRWFFQVDRDWPDREDSIPRAFWLCATVALCKNLAEDFENTLQHFFEEAHVESALDSGLSPQDPAGKLL